MKATINLDSFTYTIFKTKEDFDQDPYSPTSREKTRRLYERGLRPYMERYQYMFEPDRFPCIMIDLGTISNPNGADFINALYIYNFELIDEE